MRIMRSVLVPYLLVSGMHAQAAEHPIRGLLVFLDQKEKGYVGALSDELFIALAQNAGPMLASTSLLKNVFSEYGKNMDDPSYWNEFKGVIGATPKVQNEKLLKLFKKLEKYQNVTDEDIHQEKKAAYKYILLKAIHFNPLQWVIKRVNEFLYLLIPVSYLQEHGIDVYNVRLDTAQAVSNTELQLGLHVNHMQTVNIEDILHAPRQDTPTDYVIKTVYDDAEQKSSIFCLRSEYRNQPIAMPTWTILITGHGQGGSKIVDLEIEDFKKVLDFLEHKILCNLLVYVSCFSAGVNIQAVYNDMKNNLQKTYSFPIIMQALTDAVVFAISSYLEVDSAGNLQIVLKKNYSFKAFLQAAAQPDITDYADVVKYIFKMGADIKPNDAAQIKMPGLEWFSVLEKDQVAAIGTILAQSRDSNKPLNIATFFKKDPRIILLYASDIPFALGLNPGIKAIVSMIPGDAVHRLQSVSSLISPVDTIIKTFMKIDTLNPQKLFFIKKIKGSDKTIDDVLVVYTKTASPYISANDIYNCIAYYIDNNIVWVKNTKQGLPRKATPQEIQQYQNYIQRITGQPQYIPLATYHPIVEWELPNITFSGPLPLSKYAIIETIEADAQTPLEDILDTISSMQPDHAITLIRQLRGIPLNDASPVFLTNVIVDKEHARILYTLNGRFFDDKQELAQDYMPSYIQLLTPQPLFAMRQGSLLPLAIKNRLREQSKKRKRDD